jgi:hypothetical protein
VGRVPLSNSEQLPALVYRHADDEQEDRPDHQKGVAGQEKQLDVGVGKVLRGQARS